MFGTVTVDACRRGETVTVEPSMQITHDNPRAKGIVMSGMIDDTIREEALAAGASGFLHKSAAGTELIVAIKRVWTESTRLMQPPS